MNVWPTDLRFELYRVPSGAPGGVNVTLQHGSSTVLIETYDDALLAGIQKCDIESSIYPSSVTMMNDGSQSLIMAEARLTLDEENELFALLIKITARIERTWKGDDREN